MAAVDSTQEWDVPIEKLYKVLSNYEEYPDFIPDCDSVEVLKKTPKSYTVKYELSLIKKIDYTIELTHDRKKDEKNINWKLVNSKFFKKNSGCWKLEKLGPKKTRVTYALDVEFSMFVPKPIVNKLIGKSLPKMMEVYKKRALQ
jgi:coenzyme Q-binding protein COQ10